MGSQHYPVSGYSGAEGISLTILKGYRVVQRPLDYVYLRGLRLSWGRSVKFKETAAGYGDGK